MRNKKTLFTILASTLAADTYSNGDQSSGDEWSFG